MKYKCILVNQKIGKNAQMLKKVAKTDASQKVLIYLYQISSPKVAKTVAKSESVNVSISMINLKVQNIYKNYFRNLQIPTANYVLKLLL
jgi:hypothetical protein